MAWLTAKASGATLVIGMTIILSGFIGITLNGLSTSRIGGPMTIRNIPDGSSIRSGSKIRFGPTAPTIRVMYGVMPAGGMSTIQVGFTQTTPVGLKLTRDGFAKTTPVILTGSGQVTGMTILTIGIIPMKPIGT